MLDVITSDKAHKIYIRGALLLSAVVIVYTCAYFFHLMFIDGPLEYREGAMVATTALLNRGLNPYALENLPGYVNTYGIMFHLLAVPFVKAGGAVLVVHRALSLLFIALSCWLIFFILRTKKVSLTLSLVAAALLFHQLGLSRVVNKPDALGLYLFLLSVVVPWKYRYSCGSLLVSGMLGSLGLLTKAYFFLGVPFLGLYMFLFVSKLRGATYAATAVAMAVGALFMMDYLCENYILSTLLVYREPAARSLDWVYLKQQTAEYVKSLLSLLIGFSVAILVDSSATLKAYLGKLKNPTPLICFGSPSAPLIEARADFMAFLLVCMGGLVTFKLGGHGGAWMTYYYELISPFLLVVAMETVDRVARRHVWRTVLVFMVLAQLSLTTYGLVGAEMPVLARYQRQWTEWRILLSDYQKVLNSPPIAPILLEQDKRVYDSGHSEYFHRALSNAEGIMVRLLGQRGEVLAARAHYNSYVSDINKLITNRSFDLIVLTRNYNSAPLYDRELVRRHYIFEDVSLIDMFRQKWELEIWLPKPTEML